MLLKIGNLGVFLSHLLNHIFGGEKILAMKVKSHLNKLLEKIGIIAENINFTSRKGIILLIGIIVLFLIEQQNYLLFHTWIEGFCVTTAFLIYTLANRTFKYSDNSFLLYIGIAYFSIFFLDFFHLATYKGIGIIPEVSADTSTQLWIAGRLVEAISLLSATFLIERRFSKKKVFTVYCFLTIILLASILWLEFFPVCYIEGKGLTIFKIAGEYLICLIIGAAIYNLSRQKAMLNRTLYWHLVASMASMILAEFSFTLYTDVYGIFNSLGHFLKLFSYYLIYNGIVVQGIDYPFDLIFKKLKEKSIKLEANQLLLESELSKTQQKVVNILESITDGFFTLDKEWRITYSNNAVGSFFVTDKPRELIGKNLWELYPHAVNGLYYQKFHQVMANRESTHFESHGICRDCWYEIHCYPAEVGLSIYIHEISERKLIEETNRRLAAIVETSEDAIISMTPEGKISSWNLGASKLYGYSAEEAKVNSALKMVLDENHQQIRDEWGKLNEGHHLEDNCAVRIRKDGTPIYVSIKSSLIRDSTGKIIEISSIHRDITERIKSNEALAKERELLMVTLNSLTEGVIATDSDDRIFLINQAALSLTGCSQLEVIDETLGKILYVIDDKTSEPVNLGDLNSDEFQRKDNHLILVTNDLKEVPVSIHSSPIKSADARIIGAVTVFTDITEKQQTEQELFKAEKLESLGILAGGIAHDFNNLLAAILSNIQLAQMKYKKNGDIEKYLQQSMESAHRASELTRQLLTFSKGGAPAKKAASIAELISDTAKFALRGSKVKVNCRVPETLWPVEVDTGQLSQVIHNLAINAKQAMPKGGIFEIRLENVVIEPNFRFKPGNYIKISFKDQGVGIPKENLSKIFDPFFTTKKEGSGLGLATSYSIIRQHDGYLEVDSEVGKGTTFFIYLPALSEITLLPETRKKVAVGYERLKILLMDDEELILKSMREMLELNGHQVTVVMDGEKAIRTYREGFYSGVPFDVVIMDLTIPGGMGGQETIAHLLDIDPRIKAIVSSGYANDPIISDYERFGFHGVVIKPYKIDELNEVLNRVVERKQLTLEFDAE